MAITTSITLDDHFANFISSQVRTGRFASVDEVVSEALRIFEHEERKKEQLRIALQEGSDSGIVEDFDPKEFLAGLHTTYVQK